MEKVRFIVFLFGLLVVFMPFLMIFGDWTNVKIFTRKEYWCGWVMFMAAVFLIIQKDKEKSV